MTSLLFQALPAIDSKAWNDFLRAVSAWVPQEGVEQLGPNVWLLPSHGGADLELGRICRQHAIASRCLAIAHKSEWQNLP